MGESVLVRYCRLVADRVFGGDLAPEGLPFCLELPTRWERSRCFRGVCLLSLC